MNFDSLPEVQAAAMRKGRAVEAARLSFELRVRAALESPLPDLPTSMAEVALALDEYDRIRRLPIDHFAKGDSDGL